MQETIPFQKRSKRLQNSLSLSIEHFRKGNDHLGLDSLLNTLDDLENLLEFKQYTGDLWGEIEKIAPLLQTIYKCVKNQDVTRLTDVLEFTFYPLTKEWTEEVIDQ